MDLSSKFLSSLLISFLFLSLTNLDSVSCHHHQQQQQQQRSERVSYAGYSLYRSTPQTEHHIEKLRQLMEEKKEEKGVQFWTEPQMLNHTVDIMVSPDDEGDLREFLRQIRVPTKKVMHDIEEVIRRTSRVHPIERKSTRTLFNNNSNNNSTSFRDLRQTLEAQTFFTRYSRYVTIESKLRELANDQKVSLEVAGKSFEGRNMYLVKISSDPSANKPIIFLDAGHHAREWISHATLLYIMESLLNTNMPEMSQLKPSWRKRSIETQSNNGDNKIASENDTKQKLDENLMSKLKDFDFWFVPVVNPDGYEYSHTTDRNWRKTRSVQGSNICPGTDPNRNYPNHWNEAGVSRFSCSNVYSGIKALSEPETALVARLLKENASRIKMYLTLHAYSQLILLPYGYDRVKPDNYDDLMKVANSGISAINGMRGTQYKAGVSSIVLYPAAGGSDDYAHGNCGIRQAFTIELPDTGDHGFLLPAHQIIPVGQETVRGIKAMIDTMQTI